MTTLRELFNRLRDRSRRDDLTAELDAELRFHQGMLERDEGARGASADAARRFGRMQLGNPTYVKEETRDMWSLGLVDDVLQDIRYAARVLRRNVGFTIVVVLTLALGIGANTAIFSVVNAVLLRPLPYADPDQLYAIWTVPAGSPTDRNPTSYPDLLDWQAQSKAFSGIGGYAFNRFELSGPEGVDQARAIMGSATLYEILGARPFLGRLPRPEEVRLPVVTLSHRLWQRRYGGDRSVIGRTVIMEEQPYTIIGVMPPGFHFPSPDVDMWMSMHSVVAGPGGSPNSPWITNRGLRGYRTLARLRPGVTVTMAEAEMNAIEHRLAVAYPDEDAGTNIKLHSIREDSIRNVQRGLWLILGAAGLVLLLACANVAHLMLARTSTRTREIAVRRALGAHRGRVVRQLITESVVLGAIGGTVGLGVAKVAMELLVRLSPGDIPRLENVSIDATTLAFAGGASIVTGLLFGIAPTVVAWKSGMQETLREQGRGATGGRHAGRMRAVLTSAEVAFALMLLVGAGLMVRSFASLLTNDMGFQADGVVTFHIGLTARRYPTPTDRVAVLNRVILRLQAIPGVTSVGASTSMPPTRMQQANGFTIEGDPAPEPGQESQAVFVPATPSFFASIGIPVLSGRPFRDGDGANSPKVAIINRELVKRHFANRNPIGRRMRVADSLWTIVGVVGDVTYEGLGKPTRPQMYVPFAQSPFGGAWVGVKASRDPSSLVTPIRDAIHEIDPLMNARDLRPMNEMVGDSVVRPRFQTWLLATFGGLALILAAIGIYGVVAYSVAQRTSEIGLRLALGATPRSVIGLVLRSGMTPVVVGLAVGVSGALALSKVMIGLLYDVAPTDTLTFVGMTLLLGGVAIAAAYLPAVRAAKLDPILALRSE